MVLFRRSSSYFMISLVTIGSNEYVGYSRVNGPNAIFFQIKIYARPFNFLAFGFRRSGKQKRDRDAIRFHGISINCKRQGLQSLPLMLTSKILKVQRTTETCVFSYQNHFGGR